MKLVLGGPGCGKTSRLLEIMEGVLATCEPDQIGFLAFTRKAAHEARERAAAKFNFKDADMHYFRTIHSLAFKQLGLRPEEIMRASDYAELGAACKLQLTVTDNDYGLPLPGDHHSRAVFLEQLARVTGQSLTKLTMGQMDYWTARYYRDSLNAYKKARGLMDFTDMVTKFVQEGTAPKLKALFVDEAQDLSPIHWLVVDKLVPHAEQVFIAGDDDQAIFRWAGADVQRFLNLQGEKEVLELSHRLPRRLWQMSDMVAHQIKSRYEKTWRGRDDEGVVRHYAEHEAVDVTEGTWMLLARNEYLLRPLVKTLRARGHPYIHKGKSSVDEPYIHAILDWEDLRKGRTVGVDAVRRVYARLHKHMLGPQASALARVDENQSFTMDRLLSEYGLLDTPDWMAALKLKDAERDYVRAVRRRGEHLRGTPRIRVSTVHGVKGGEADHVMLLQDMSSTSYRSYATHGPGRDDELRVQYVGVSRQRHGLHLVHPQSGKYFSLPRV